MSEILEIGSVIPVDAEGYLVRDLDAARIQPRWREAVDFAVALYREHLGADLSSVYVRGSVARGEAVEGVSDVDTFALAKEAPQDYGPGWGRDAHRRFVAAFPFTTGLEVIVLNRHEILEDERKRQWRFLLVTQAVCVEGEDVIPGLPRFRPDVEAVAFLRGVRRAMRRMRAELPGEETAAGRASLFAWAAKRVLRAGMELVMTREQAYSKDLWPSYAMFARHYPDRGPAMRRALEWVLAGPEDPAAAADHLEDLGEFLATEGADLIAAAGGELA